MKVRIVLLVALLYSFQPFSSLVPAPSPKPNHVGVEDTIPVEEAELARVLICVHSTRRFSDADLTWWLGRLNDDSLRDSADGGLLRANLLGRLLLLKVNYTPSQDSKVYQVAHHLLSDPNPMYRQLVLHLMGKLRDPRAGKDIDRSRNDPDPSVVAAAEDAAKRRAQLIADRKPH